jgi:hypothetical protein
MMILWMDWKDSFDQCGLCASMQTGSLFLIHSHATEKCCQLHGNCPGLLPSRRAASSVFGVSPPGLPLNLQGKNKREWGIFHEVEIELVQQWSLGGKALLLGSEGAWEYKLHFLQKFMQNWRRKRKRLRRQRDRENLPRLSCSSLPQTPDCRPMNQPWLWRSVNCTHLTLAHHRMHCVAVCMRLHCVGVCMRLYAVYAVYV